MTLKMFSIATVALGLAMGAAYAQTTNEADQTAPSGRDIQNPEVVGPMFTDKEMTKMRSTEEMKSEWDKLPEEQHTKIKGECADPQNEREQDFCDVIGGF